jgi:DNA-binding response OmpR family regulator
VKLLIIDDNSDHRLLLSKTLLRKFPHAVLVECRSAEAAVNILKSERVTLVVAHRAHEVADAGLIRALRSADAVVPIIAVAGADQKGETLAAGATQFHDLDEWLMIGNAAAALLDQPPSSEVL